MNLEDANEEDIVVDKVRNNSGLHLGAGSREEEGRRGIFWGYRWDSLDLGGKEKAKILSKFLV